MLAEYDENYANYYPPTCFVYFDKRKFLVKDIYIYKQGFLTEHGFAAGEGFASVKIDLLDRSTYCGMSCNQMIMPAYGEKYIDINSVCYEFITNKMDTLVYKNSAHNMLLVVGDKL